MLHAIAGNALIWFIIAFCSWGFFVHNTAFFREGRKGQEEARRLNLDKKEIFAYARKRGDDHYNRMSTPTNKRAFMLGFFFTVIFLFSLALKLLGF